ncbi:MAG TPA: aminomethyltransferase family protein [Actinomycetes bacterium]|nr:aminomethyltransferase family protein [Actinomycetes bacterium]
MTESETNQNRSVLYDVQVAQGAGFIEYGDWSWATNFGDAQAEYRAIRTGVCLWDVYALQKWDVTGPEAIAAIQRVFTNNLATLAVGQVRYGAFVNADGAMIDDGTVYKHSDDHLWVMTNADDFPSQIEGIIAGLDVTLTPRTSEMPLIAVQGPGSRELLQGLTDVDLSELRYFRFLTEQVSVAGVPVWIMRTGFSGELGFELIPSRDRAVELWQTLTAAGGVPVGLDAIEVARVEAGLVVIDADYTPGETSPFDLSFDKMIAIAAQAPIVGADILSKTAEAPPLRFKTLRIEGHEVPEYGAAIRKDGVVVGTVTSPADSPTFGVIGLATIATDYAANGTSVEVAIGEGGTRSARAFVTDLSIHDPDKRKPRS